MRPSELFSHVPPAACRERRCSVAGPRTFLLASCPHRRWQAQETTETEVIIGKRRKKERDDEATARGVPVVIQCARAQRGLHLVCRWRLMSAQNTPGEPPERRGSCNRHKRGCEEI